MNDLSQQLVERVKAAFAQGEQLRIAGNGTKEFMGREQKGHAFDIAGHTGVVSYNPAELVMVARSGTTIAEINHTLAESGQILPCESPLNGNATLGGVMACNQSGPARPWRGGIRDCVLGLHMINGKGEYLRFGGQVIKNVAGYDITRLQAGAMGSLGVLTEISFKVIPKPDVQETLVLPLSVEQALDRMNALLAQSLPLSGACWHADKMYLRFSGAGQAVQAATQSHEGDTLSDDTEFWSQLNEKALEFFTQNKPLWRFSIRPTAQHFLPEGDWLIDWAGAQRWLCGDYPIEELREYARASGGQVELFSGGDRHGEVMHQPDPVTKDLLIRMKNAFDPKGIFNPGRLYSWL
ncbi:MAG: glycolate oxidase subunit GlcE [Pseudomonadales bacterium]